MPLTPIAEGAWAHERDIRMPVGRLPCRSTILRLTDDRLAVVAPLGMDDATVRAIEALGEVGFLVAPNGYHWLFLKRAAARFPKARVLGAPGLAKKLGDLPFEPLPVSGAVEGMPGLRLQRVQGAPAMEEHVLLHEPSGSLVVTDLVFNVRTCPSFGIRCVLWLNGTWGKTAQSRLWRFLVKDRPAAAQSALDILAWDFERVVVAHGDVVEEDAHARTRAALTWMTAGAPKLLGAPAPPTPPT